MDTAGGGGGTGGSAGKMTSKKKEQELAQAIFEEWNTCRPRRISKKRFVEIEVEGVGMVSVRKEEEEEEEKEEEEEPRLFALAASGRQVDAGRSSTSHTPLLDPLTYPL